MKVIVTYRQLYISLQTVEIHLKLMQHNGVHFQYSFRAAHYVNSTVIDTVVFSETRPNFE
jgi:hypothetical protein